jgi:hypothetical protein
MSTWISPPPLKNNGLNYIKFLHQMGKLLLNLTPGEPLSLMKKLNFFDESIELDIILAGVLRLGFHDPINCCMFNVL